MCVVYPAESIRYRMILPRVPRMIAAWRSIRRETTT
jgi:hypothetical protein